MKRNPSRRRAGKIANTLRQMCPLMPLADFGPVTERAGEAKFSHLPPSIAVWQVLVSHVRHQHSAYDSLLAEGYDRDAARFFVADEVNEVLAHWGCARRIEVNEE